MEAKKVSKYEENVRVHIHCDVINCLREEGMNMQHIEVAVAWCDDWMKRHLIVDRNEKRFGTQRGEKYCRRRIFEKLFERMKVCKNNDGDYFEYLIK